MNRLFLCGCVALFLLTGCSGGKESCSVCRVSLNVLLSRMTNLNTFAEAPLGDSFLASSYDRSGGNQDWAVYTKADANGRVTIFDEDGPGYISRFWIASFEAERWLFFFDGESEPRLTLSKQDLFGGKFPFVEPLAGLSGGGRYSLVPMPFSKSLRIEIEPSSLKPSNRNYFHVNYTKLNLPSGKVDSFPEKLTVAQSNMVMEVNSFQSANTQQLKALITFDQSKEILPQKEMVFWQDDGEGILENFCVRFDKPVASEVMGQKLLRYLRLQMFWDGASEPSVDVPLGDFFCNPIYTRTFSSMPLGQVDGAFVCRFPMPYRKGARCVLKNTSSSPVSVSIGARGDRESSGSLSRKFHAVWQAQSQSGVPFQMMKTSGSGHYVGCFLSAIGQDGTWTILEGDEILRPDPEEQPPQFGTGLEDYFNGAYYYTSLFDLPLHGLIEKGAMRTDQYRFHMLEAVPFDQSFSAEIEFGDQNHAKGYMSSVVYWYADQVAEVPLSGLRAHLLKHPGDRFALHGLMAPFYLLEREGLFADAADRMDYFAERYRSQPWSDRLKVRALAYREEVEGFDAIRAELSSFVGNRDPVAAQAAKDRLWLAEDPSHALLGIHALGKYRVFQDEKLVTEGSGRADLRVLRQIVDNRPHAWQVELEPTQQGSFFALCLRTQNGDITSAGEWEIVDAVPQSDRKIPEVFEGRQVLPNMTIWAFEPTSVINMQSPASGIRLWAPWRAYPDVKSVTLRKEWSVADIQSESVERERSDDELKAHAIN